ncbi:MAG: bifunctional diguanylate cyclase/phosphodiesterase [Rhodocyclaceae bacterium]
MRQSNQHNDIVNSSPPPSLHPALPAWDEAPLQLLVKGMARIGCAVLVFGIIQNILSDTTMRAMVCTFALFPTAALALPNCPLPYTTRALLLSGTLTATISALILIGHEGTRDVSMMALPAVTLIASLTIKRLPFILLTAATLGLVLFVGVLEISGHEALSLPQRPGWRHLASLCILLAGFAVMTRMIANKLLDTLRRLHFETLINSQTGLPNRNALEQVAARFLQGSSGSSGSVIALSPQRLDSLDSMFGHTFGDAVLRHAASIIGRTASNKCIAGHWGENTFVLLIAPAASSEPETTAGSPAAMAQEIRLQLRQPHMIDGVAIHLDAHCGLCTGSSTGFSPLERIERALIALDEAKRRSTDAVIEYREEYSQRIALEYRYENALRQAIERKCVRMDYQPILAAEDGKVIALEALLRLSGDDQQPIPALAAIQLAEASGLIHRLGQTIVHAVLADITCWRGSGTPLLPVSINFSALQLTQPELADDLAACLAEHQLGPAAIIAEVTETAATSDDNALAQTLATLAQSGVALAIDDFGSGYASLTRLLDVPAELIKFDCSLIHSAAASSEAHEFLRRTVHLAHSTQARVLIEGIETAAQAKLVNELGCFAVQGYWYAKPMPANAIPAFLADREIACFQPTRTLATPPRLAPSASPREQVTAG